MYPQMKFFYPKVKSIDATNRRITVCISKDEVDRHGERVEISAIAEALQQYATNPVVLGDHQHRLASGESSVIGHSPPQSFRVSKDEVDIDILFSTTKNAETYWVNYRDGHQRAVSIGFMELEWKTEDEDGRKVWVITKLELLEVSCVAVGANRGALVKQKDKFDRLASPDSTETKNAALQAIMETFQSELTRLHKQVSLLTEKTNELIHAENSSAEKLDEIITLLIANQDGYAEGLLGGPQALSGPAGDKMSEQLERIQTLVTSGG